MNIIYLSYLLQHVSADLYGHHQIEVKVKLSLRRPGQGLRVPAV